MNNHTLKNGALKNCALGIALAACYGSAQAKGTLNLEIITPSGDDYSAQQELGDDFESFASGAISTGEPPGEYQAIRCDGPWGPQKYRVALASGPGFRLRVVGDRLVLQILEHSVISEDLAIAAMRVHCVDTEPRQVVKSLLEIELDRTSAAAEQLQLINGYLLEYRYKP